VITAPFDYEAPESLEEAVRMLHENGEDAKALAGGHSLLPLMKVRLAAPTLLVDLRRIPGLHGLQRADGGWRIGAMTRHADLQDTTELTVLSRAAGMIADQQVRNRGTIGGSLAHGDPASDLPAVVLALDGEVTARGPSGERTIAAGDLFEDYLTTSLAHDELITEIRLPPLDGWGFGYEKFTRRAEDWAMVGVCALVKQAPDGSCEDVRIGLTNMGSTALRATAAEDALRGQPLDIGTVERAADQAADGTEPVGDLNATPEYKRHLARVLTRRALKEAANL
jgi:aerobic carbon-monoxide dehydrogenase medium subunit